MDKAKAQFKRFSRGWYRYIIYGLLGIILFALSWYFAKSGQISGVELTIFRALNDAPSYIADIFLAITFLGSLGTAWILAAIFFAFKRYVFALELFLASTGAFLFAGFLKGLDIRARPYQILDSVKIHGFKYADMGFPSVHMAVFAALAIVLLPRLNSKFKIFIYILGLLVGVSRIVLGMHAPLDIIGGLGVGILVGSAVNYYAGIPKPRLLINKKKLTQKNSIKTVTPKAKYAK